MRLSRVHSVGQLPLQKAWPSRFFECSPMFAKLGTPAQLAQGWQASATVGPKLVDVQICLHPANFGAMSARFGATSLPFRQFRRQALLAVHGHSRQEGRGSTEVGTTPPRHSPVCLNTLCSQLIRWAKPLLGKSSARQVSSVGLGRLGDPRSRTPALLPPPRRGARPDMVDKSGSTFRRESHPGTHGRCTANDQPARAAEGGRMDLSEDGIRGGNRQ